MSFPSIFSFLYLFIASFIFHPLPGGASNPFSALPIKKPFSGFFARKSPAFSITVPTHPIKSTSAKDKILLIFNNPEGYPPFLTATRVF